MSDIIYYDGQSIIILSGQEYRITGNHLSNYVAIFNQSKEPVYISKYTNPATNKDHRVIMPKECDYLPIAIQKENFFYIAGNGEIEVKTFGKIKDCVHYVKTMNDRHFSDNFCNANLLVNPDFRINQRGKTEYGNSQYCVDKWRTSTKGILSIGDNKRIVFSASGGNAWLMQDMNDICHQLIGKEVTISICYEGNIYCASGVVPEGIFDSSQNVATAVVNNKMDFSLWRSGDGNSMVAQIRCVSGYSISPEWVKVEVGSVATAFSLPLPSEEFPKCYRYFAQIFDPNGEAVQCNGIGRTVSDTVIRFTVTLPVAMRSAVPKIVSSGTLYASNGYPTDNNTFLIEKIISSSLNGNMLQIDCMVANGLVPDYNAIYYLARKDGSALLSVSTDF